MSRHAVSLVRWVVLLCASFWFARAQDPPVASVEPLLKEGDSAFTRGDYPAARQSFEKAWQIAQQAPADSALRYDVLKRLTSASTASGNFDVAAGYLQQAMRWRESIAGPNNLKIADDLAILVNLYLSMKDFDQALAAAQRAQAIHVAAYTAESLPVADDFVRIAQIYLAQKKPNDAVRPLITAHGIRTKLVGALDPGLLPVLDRLNEAFGGVSGRGMEAVYREALTIRETLYGKDSAELISTLDGLAYTCFQNGEEEAEPLYQRLLSLWENTVGKDHPMVAVTLDKLVVLYAKWNRPAEARAALARSVAIREQFLAIGLSHQAADATSENQLEQARTLYKRAIAEMEFISPANEELIAQIKRALAVLETPQKPDKIILPTKE